MGTMRTYCDYNATAPLRPEAKTAMLAAMELVGNPSSVHGEGRRARAIVERARDRVGEAIGACRDDVVFCSGGTEAVQAVLRGALAAIGAKTPKDLIASELEHDAVYDLWRRFHEESAPGKEMMHRFLETGDQKWAERAAPLLTEHGAMVWPTLQDGRVDLEFLRIVMEAHTRHAPPELSPGLVSLMLVNNETGVIQPVAEAAEIVHAAGGLIHCDAIQGLGKTPVSVIDLDVDYLSVSSHKIGGPQGVGAFYVRPGAPFAATMTGGGQELYRRAGTENVAGIAGFGAACDAAIAGLGEYEGLRAHRDAMEAKLKAAVPALQVHGEAAPRVAGVSCFGVEGWPAETQIMGMDLAGFALSAGAACSSGKVKPSRVLTAMGLGDSAAQSAVRASFGWASRPEDFEALADAWIALVSRARPELVKEELADAGR